MSDEKDDKPPEKALVKRVVGKPFPKGKSGNPGGQPHQTRDMIRLAREGCSGAIARLRAIVEDFDSHPLAAVAAARELLDRGYGRARQILPGESLDEDVANLGDGSAMSALLASAQSSKRKVALSSPPSPPMASPLTPEERKLTGLDVMLAQARASKNNNGKLASVHETLENLVGKDRAAELMGRME